MREHEKLELTSREAAETKMEEGKAKAARKRAHVSLTIEQKVEILDLIEKKTSYKLLSEKYGIGISTISDIKKKGGELKSYKRKLTEMECKRPAKTMKLGRDNELEEAVFLWFIQLRPAKVHCNSWFALLIIFLYVKTSS